MAKIAELIITKKKISELIPHPKNPNTHDEKQIKKLAHLIKTHGFSKGSVVIQKSTSMILAGHGIVEALKTLGYTDVDVVEADLTDDKAMAFMIADNHVASQSVIDDIGLQQVINELSELNVPALDFAFDDDDLSALADRILAGSGGSAYEASEQDDIVPEVKEAITQKGDLWTLGKHRVLCGDSTCKDDVDRLMGGEKADMVFTDPPYAVNYGADQDLLNKKSGNKFRLIARPIIGDNLTTEECAEQLWKPAFKNLYDSSKDDCSFYMTMCQGGDQMMMMMMMMSENWQIKHELIWVKSSPVFSMGRLDYDYKHEPILFGWKKKHNFYGNGQFKNSVWEIPKPNKSDLHPTTKPIDLIANALLNSSLENQTILDLFLGSGSTLIACEKLNRVCYGMEIDCHYCDVIVKRYADFVGSTDNIFVERDGQRIGYADIIA